MRLIDADALPRLKMTIKNEWHMHEEVEVVYADDIDNAPTIDPVKHGEWVHIKDILYECSVCHKSYTVPAVEVPYCWNCGARMDGGEEDAD